MFLLSLSEISKLSRDEKKLILRANRWYPFRKWPYWIALLMYVPYVQLLIFAISSLAFMAFMTQSFMPGMVAKMFLLPFIASMIAVYVPIKVQHFYLAPRLLSHVSAHYPTKVAIDVADHLKIQSTRKKQIFAGVVLFLLTAAIHYYSLFSAMTFTPEPVAEGLKQPRVETNKIAIAKSRVLKREGLGAITDIIMRKNKASKVELIIAGTHGALVTDHHFREKKYVKLNGKFDPISVVQVDSDSIGYINRGSWCSQPYLMDSNGNRTWSYSGGDSGVDDMAAGDINGDGLPEFVVGFNGGGGLHLLDHNGHKVWSKPDGNVWHIEIVDVDGDGHQKIVHSNAGGYITIRNENGEILK